MTSIHVQAMNHVYQQVLKRLLSFCSRAERTALQLLIQRLVVAAGGMESIGDYKVLAIQTGSRDSCYTLAMLRAAQLSIAGRAPTTFRLRVASLQSHGVNATALEIIHRSNSALFLYDDPRVEVLMADNREVLPFSHPASISEAGKESSRLNLLMVGHRRTGDAVPGIWDNGYLATAEFYGHISRFDNGVDALVGSESPRQRKQFLEGFKRASAKAGSKLSRRNATSDEDLFVLLDGLGGNCYRGFYPELEQVRWRPAKRFEACRRTAFIDIHDLLLSNLQERWPLLTELLGLQPDEVMTQLGDNEYASLNVSAHLHGLFTQFVHGGDYDAGVVEYLQRVMVMMRRKQFPEHVCRLAEVEFGLLATHPERRALATTEAEQSLGLNEAQLVCLLFAPFADKGAALERFLHRCYPGMLVGLPDLHRALQGQSAPEQVQQWMVTVSGLPINLIAKLYRMDPVNDDSLKGTSFDIEIAMAGGWSVDR